MARCGWFRRYAAGYSANYAAAALLGVGLLLTNNGAGAAVPLSAPAEADASVASNLRAEQEQAQAKAQLPKGAWQRIQQQIETDQYRIQTRHSAGEALFAPNARQGYRTAFAGDGPVLRLTGGAETDTADGDKSTEFRLQLVALRQGEHELRPAVQAVGIDPAQQNRLVYQREHGVDEWYVNRARGIEQGFTLAKPIAEDAADSTDWLQVVLAPSDGWQGQMAEGGESLRFSRASTTLRYSGLKAWDAEEQLLPAQMRVANSGEVVLAVDARKARYPLTIDPVIQNESQKLTASDGAAHDWFGISVAISGDTVVVGAYGDDDKATYSGSAYVFARNQGGDDSWGQVKKLTASDGEHMALFGISVAISGDTVVVGADGNDGRKGAAYVFARNQGSTDNWGQVKKLTASDGATYDYFGRSVAISGDTVVVGADENDDKGSFSGAAYVFARHQGGIDNWGEVKMLTASDGAARDHFGYSVAISGDTVVVGAYGDGDNGSDSGSAYVFARNQGGPDHWGEFKKLTASDGASRDWFGTSVAISGDTVVVGAYGDDDNGSDSGSAYVFARGEGGTDNWGEVKKLTASDGTYYYSFGYSVAISGDTVVVGAYGAYGDGGNWYDTGSAYVFARGEGGMDNWGEVKKLSASDGAQYDHFGLSVAIGGDTVVGGAFRGGNDYWSDSGSAYVFDLLIAQCQSGLELALDENGEATLDARELDAGSLGAAVWDVDRDTFSCDDLGSQEVTLTVSNATGNTASCTTEIEVVDNIAPSFQQRKPGWLRVGAPTPEGIQLTPEVLAEMGVLGDNGGDNCGTANLGVEVTKYRTDEVVENQLLSLGRHWVNVTISDASGNQASQLLPIWVTSDRMPPRIHSITTDPAPITLTAWAPDQYVEVDILTNVSDNRDQDVECTVFYAIPWFGRPPLRTVDRAGWQRWREEYLKVARRQVTTWSLIDNDTISLRVLPPARASRLFGQPLRQPGYLIWTRCEDNFGNRAIGRTWAAFDWRE